MKVLITSGGTKIKIDRVRSITNMSKGTFGSKIAESFYNSGDEVVFFGSYDSRKPMFFQQKAFLNRERIEKKDGYFNQIGKHKIYAYETFEDYEKSLFELIKKEKPEVIILSAAVSDYGIENYVDGKIRTTSENMVIRLKPLPKLISRVREASPESFVVGFKLLVDSTEEELKRACVYSMYKNKLDMIVGNDLSDIQRDNHTLIIGSLNNSEICFEKHSKNESKIPLSDIVKNKIKELVFK